VAGEKKAGGGGVPQKRAEPAASAKREEEGVIKAKKKIRRGIDQKGGKSPPDVPGRENFPGGKTGDVRGSRGKGR